MNVSPQRRCYHGNYPGSTSSYQEVPLPSMMAFQHMPPTPSPSTAPHSASSAPGTSSTLAALGDASSFGQPGSGSWESEGFMEEFSDMEEQQDAGTMRSEEMPYIGGRFRTYGTMMSNQTQSWHQPVSEEPGEMQFYPAQQQPAASSFAPQMQEPGPSFSGGNGYGSYDNGMGQMITPSTAATPYYHNHSHQLAAPSSSYFMGPESMNQPQQQHLHQQQLVHHRHYESMGELNDRRTYPSGNHLSIMSSNLSPSDHMLHIYPSSMANSTNGREARNRAEKNRRDKLNRSIQELGLMVPEVKGSVRRVDKTAVLRLAAHGLRLKHVFKNTVGTTERSAVTDTFLDMLNVFLLTVTCRGQIVLVSNSLEQHLGHCQTDWYGQDILTYTHPDDHVFLKQQLVPTDLETLFDVQPMLDSSGEQRPRTKEEEDLIDQKLRQDRRDITIRLARAGPRSEPTVYEIVRLTGYFRRADLAPRGTKLTNFPGLHMIRRARTREESFLPLHTISGNDIVLVAFALIVRAPKICDRLLEACKTEYKTRHLIDGRIVQCEQAISIVAGYMTDEITGLSPFAFMHKDEVRWVMVALRQMYDYNKPFGESCYRLMSRTGKFIYLKTRGYLEIDKDTNKVHSFVCINTLVSEEEGKRMVSEMKRKFSIIIDPDATHTESIASDSNNTEEMSVENPRQIEQAIMNLITNLEPSGASTSGAVGALTQHSRTRDDAATRAIAAVAGPSDTRSTHSPPLAIIAPQPSTIKPSVTKTMQVIQGKRPAQRRDSESDEDSDGDADEEAVKGHGKSLQGMTSSVIERNVMNTSRPSVLQRNTSQGYLNNNCSTQGSVEGVSGNSSFPVIIKPELRECNNMSDGGGQDQSIDINYSSQFLQIKQEEILPSELLHSPASSTVSSLSYDRAGSSNSSTTIIMGKQGGGASVIALKRYVDTGEASGSRKRLRRSSRSLDDIPDVGTSYELQSPSSNNGSDLISNLPTYFDALDRSLDRIGNATEELRDQFLMIAPDNNSEGSVGVIADGSSTSEVSRSTDQLARIVEEQIEQRGILYSIKQEFGGRFPQNSSNSSNSIGAGSSSQYADDGEEDVVFASDKDGSSFDTNNLMPD